MAETIDPRAAFSAFSTGIPRVVASIEEQIALGNVRLVYAEKPEDIRRKDYRDWLVRYHLLTDDEAFRPEDRPEQEGIEASRTTRERQDVQRLP